MNEENKTRAGRLQRSQKEDDTVVQGRKLIVTIGIDKYMDLPQLKNAVNDANGIHELFTQDLGFEAPFAPLLNEAATESRIKELIEEELPEEVEEDDTVVVFFAGHGESYTVGKSGKIHRGYLIPVNARRGRISDYLRLKHFLDNLGELPVRHIMVILDACHSGFALGNAMISMRSAKIPAYAQNLLDKKSRHVLTSALAEQEALDGGPVPGHSLFTGCLIHGLRTGLADTDQNGIVMTSELNAYVQSLVGKHSGGQQTPDFGRFASLQDERGELVFINKPAQIAEAPKVKREPQKQGSDLKHLLALKNMLQDKQLAFYAKEQLQKLADKDDPIVAGAAKAALKTLLQSKPTKEVTVPETITTQVEKKQESVVPEKQEKKQMQKLKPKPVSPPVSPKEEPPIEQPPEATTVVKRCKGVTKSGLQCRNKALTNSDYCGVHTKPNTKPQQQRAAKVPTAETKDSESVTSGARPTLSKQKLLNILGLHKGRVGYHLYPKISPGNQSKIRNRLELLHEDEEILAYIVTTTWGGVSTGMAFTTHSIVWRNSGFFSSLGGYSKHGQLSYGDFSRSKFSKRADSEIYLGEGLGLNHAGWCQLTTEQILDLLNDIKELATAQS